LLAKLAETSDAFEAKLAALPSSQDCQRHPGNEAVLLIDRSWQDKRPVYGCPACADDVRATRRARRMDAAGIPSDVRHASLANFDVGRPCVNPEHHTPAHFLAAAQKLQAGEIRNLILCGEAGIGKGHIAASLAIAALDEGQSVAWIDCAALFQSYHEAYRDNSTVEVIEKYAGADLTVLDELGLRDLPADGEEILFAILDRRHKRGRSTVLLGNHAKATTTKWLGGRITDRLRSGGCILRYGEWESMRGKTKDGSGDEF
jgi:DNA replication protein DnaC